MTEKQKELILNICKDNENRRDYTKKYWFSYKDFLDPQDAFTAFSCEDLDGKQGYIDLIENLLDADKTAEIFAEVYGYEEDKDERSVYSDTLIIFSRLPLDAIKGIFNAPKDIFPDDIGELTGLSNNFLIDDNGGIIPAEDVLGDDRSVYYCWWD